MNELAIKRTLKVLGKKYKREVIDFSPCVYRDLGAFDIEIEYSRKSGYSIYLWEKKSTMRIVKTLHNISIEQLAQKLAELTKEISPRNGKLPIAVV